MKRMSARAFIDTNVFLYLHDTTASVKRNVARKLIEEFWKYGGGCVSVQVLQEFYVNSTRKLGLPESEAEAQVKRLSAWQVHAPSPRDVVAAIGLHRTQQISFWDAMIVHSSAKLGCEVLYSEDLNAAQTIAGVTVVNPFMEE